MAEDTKETIELNNSIKHLNGSIRASIKSRKKHGLSVIKSTGGLIGSLLSLTEAIGGVMLSFMKFGPEVENLAAKFSMPFEQLEEKTKELSKTFKEEGIPASVWDAMTMRLHATSLGLHTNSKEMRGLFHATLVTGENFRQLIGAVGAQTLGTKDQINSTKSLFVALDETSQAFNMSREVLVKALSLLSKDTKNLLIATKAGPTKLNEVMVRLTGVMGEAGEGIMKGFSAQVNKMFTPQGMQTAFALGVPLGKIVDGTLSVKETLVELIKMNDAQLDKMNVTGVASIPFLKAIEANFGDLGAAQSFRNRIMARLTESGFKTANKSSKEIAEAILKLSKESKSSAKEFTNTWDMFKKEIMLPLMDEGLKFFKWLKPFALERKDQFISIFKSIGNIIFSTGMLIYKSIENIGNFIARKFPNLKVWAQGMTKHLSSLNSTMLKMKDDIYNQEQEQKKANAAALKNKKEEEEEKKTKKFIKAIGTGFSIHHSRIMKPKNRKPEEVIKKILTPPKSKEPKKTVSLDPQQEKYQREFLEELREMNSNLVAMGMNKQPIPVGSTPSIHIGTPTGRSV